MNDAPAEFGIGQVIVESRRQSATCGSAPSLLHKWHKP